MRKPVLQSKQQGRYQIFTANQTARWYEEITRGNIASPATNMTKLVTTEAFINYSREVLSQITQLQIDKRNISEYLQKRKTTRTNHNCGEFETIQHTVKHCQRTALKKEPLRSFTRSGSNSVVKHVKRAIGNERIVCHEDRNSDQNQSSIFFYYI